MLFTSADTIKRFANKENAMSTTEYILMVDIVGIFENISKEIR